MPVNIVTYPTYAMPVADDSWRLNIAGLVYETPDLTLRQKMLVKLLGKRMKVSASELQSELFQDRVAPFFHEPRKRIFLRVRIGDLERTLHRSTRRNGSYFDWLRMPATTIDPCAEADPWGHRFATYHIVTVDASAPNAATGRIRLIPATGLSVISDIDDTIKETLVEDRRELLVNTFLRDFRPVAGMSEVYDQWFRSGAEFHYVSSSPWQLFRPLFEHQQAMGFPPGTMHLRHFRLRDQFLKKMLILRRKGKGSTIQRILEHFPRRRFILVGDSGEKDPEIYRKMALRFGPQIVAIFIRELRSRPMDRDRKRKLQRIGNGTKVRFFRTPEQLAEEADDLIASTVVNAS